MQVHLILYHRKCSWVLISFMIIPKRLSTKELINNDLLEKSKRAPQDTGSSTNVLLDKMAPLQRGFLTKGLLDNWGPLQIVSQRKGLCRKQRGLLDKRAPPKLGSLTKCLLKKRDPWQRASRQKMGSTKWLPIKRAPWWIDGPLN